MFILYDFKRKFFLKFCISYTLIYISSRDIHIKKGQLYWKTFIKVIFNLHDLKRRVSVRFCISHAKNGMKIRLIILNMPRLYQTLSI